MQYTIEKGIPIPQKKGRPTKYPFHTIEVGESFYVPDSPTRKPISVRAYASRMSTILKGAKVFCCSRLDPETELPMQGTRVYRIK